MSAAAHQHRSYSGHIQLIHTALRPLSTRIPSSAAWKQFSGALFCVQCNLQYTYRERTYVPRVLYSPGPIFPAVCMGAGNTAPYNIGQHRTLFPKKGPVFPGRKVLHTAKVSTRRPRSEERSSRRLRSVTCCLPTKEAPFPAVSASGHCSVTLCDRVVLAVLRKGTQICLHWQGVRVWVIHMPYSSYEHTTVH